MGTLLQLELRANCFQWDSVARRVSSCKYVQIFKRSLEVCLYIDNEKCIM